MVPIEKTTEIQSLLFPYIPGFLSFREGPAIIAALTKLSRKPDLILADGQGIAHPRGLGLASYIGVLLDIPAIGCAKSRLVGDYSDPGSNKGNWSPIKRETIEIGAVVRTKSATRPLFVSPGHKIDIESAIYFTLAYTRDYRIPEPIRCANTLSKGIKVNLTH